MCAKFQFSAIIYAEVIENNSFSTSKPLRPTQVLNYLRKSDTFLSSGNPWL